MDGSILFRKGFSFIHFKQRQGNGEISYCKNFVMFHIVQVWLDGLSHNNE